MASPLPYQLPALARHAEVLSRYPASLEASIPGFGKTYVAGFMCQYLNRRPAIICPKSVVPKWYKEMADIGVRPIFVTNYEQTKLDRFAFGRWQVRNRVYEFNLPKDALLIPDEAHRFSDRTTQNAKLIVAAARQGIMTLPMSATAAQSPLDLYALGLLLGLHRGADYLGWCFQHGVYRGKFDFEFSGDRAALAKLHATIFPAHGYRATYADIPGFPEEKIEAIGVDVADADKIDAIWEKVEALEALKGEATEAITIRLRARQQAELLKIPAFKELIKDSIAEGMSVAVFVNFTETLDQLAKIFPKARIIQGGQNADERQEEIDIFQADMAHVILVQSGAGSESINLHDVHGNRPRRSLISPPESARRLIQILGRIRRSGGKSLALQTMVFAENTVEVRVRKAVEKKKGQIELINDGDLSPSEPKAPDDVQIQIAEATNDALRIFNA